MTVSEYEYSIIKTGESSQKYGNCEICGKSASEIFFQIEKKKYFNTDKNKNSYTHHECSNRIGHKDCLKSIRR